MNSPIRWAGSKRQMLHALIPLGQSINGTYIEPFAGSACLFFALGPGKAILGDLNGELIASLRQLRDDSDHVIEAMKRLKTDSASYYKLRKLKASSLAGAESAARFFMLNRLCFNGLYRTNKNGDFNVPYGRHKRDVSVDFDLFRCAAEKLQSATLVHGDFETTLDRAASGDFIFLDPPYATRSKTAFAEYLPDSFSVIDLKRLRETLDILDRRGVYFAITYFDCVEARELMEKWNPRTWTVKRNIAGFAAHRRTCTELLATNRI